MWCDFLIFSLQDLSLLFKYVVSTLKDDCKPIINDILQLIVTIYREYPSAHILVVAKTVCFMIYDKF